MVTPPCSDLAGKGRHRRVLRSRSDLPQKQDGDVFQLTTELKPCQGQVEVEAGLESALELRLACHRLVYLYILDLAAPNGLRSASRVRLQPTVTKVCSASATLLMTTNSASNDAGAMKWSGCVVCASGG